MSITRVALLVLLFVFNTIMRGARTTTKAPHFVVLVHSDPKPGESVTLTCLLVAATVPNPTSYVWIKDGEVIPGETGNTLTLKNVTREDEGLYQCGDSNSTDQMGNHSLILTYAQLPMPRICVVGGLGVALICCLPENYTDGHRIEYTWRKDNEEVAVHDSKKLWFHRVGEADAGNYTCAAKENPRHMKSPPSSPFTLAPTEDDVKPHSSARVLQGVEGGQLTLTCELSQARPGASADSFSWSRIGQDGRRRPLMGNTSTLILGPLTREDAGHYVCQARNLQECRDADLASFQVDIVYLKNLSLTSDLEVNQGDPVTLTCCVDSHPAAHLAWTVHGQEVRHVTDNLDHYVILRAGCSDSTSYTCRASNPDLPGREVSASTRLRVQPCKEGPPTPVGSGSSSEVTQLSGREGEDLTLSMNASGIPPPVYTWSGPALTPGQRSSSLTLHRLLPVDAGTYTVNVSNVHGSFLHTFSVTVQPAAGLPARTIAATVVVPIIIVVLFIAAIFIIRQRLAHRCACHRGNRCEDRLELAVEREEMAQFIGARLGSGEAEDPESAGLQDQGQETQEEREQENNTAV